MTKTRESLEHSLDRETFAGRHIGPGVKEVQEQLAALNLTDLDQLVSEAAPKQILLNKDLDLPSAISETELLKKAKELADKNKLYKTYIGRGYYGTHTPTVIQRNILENPGWYTAYTPYQAEISQGRMEALLNFQTMVGDLTGMDIANASLLDEGTAAAEAMTMCLSLQSRKKKAKKLFVSKDLFPQTLEILSTRAEPLGIELVLGEPNADQLDEECFAALVQYPTGTGGLLEEFEALAQAAHTKDMLVIAVSDLLSLCLLKPPGEMGADVVVGSSQRFGVPMAYGGPHAAFLATRDEYKRQVPGRIIGVSKDSSGQPALRLALQTREQHIRRERATSNICTAQVLLAVMASMYGVYHGPQGLKKIAERVHKLTCALADGVKSLGFELKHSQFFDTLVIETDKAKALFDTAIKQQINLTLIDDKTLSVSLDETKTPEDVEELLKVFGQTKIMFHELLEKTTSVIPEKLKRTSEFMTHPVFHAHRSETQMLRYIRQLESKDLSLTHSMIPLGSCTMKLNATTEMMPITWPNFAGLHPFVPLDQAQGSLDLIHQLESWLCEITGFAGVSLQPNAGSQGEYAGLLVIRKYHEDRGQGQRDVCLIPSSAHGTNPASAVMAGMKVVVVGCDSNGNIDMQDLKAKAEKHSEALSALMITYPSTHGVFEETIREICDLVHQHGGQVYMDGANLNALVGISQPGQIGADVSHLNLHKTFCIPHGGGGPGVGPIGVAEHLKDYLPTHSLVPECGPKKGISAVSAAPWGSAGILPISWAYLLMMGRGGLKKATEVAILNANYIAKKLEPHFPILYRSESGWVAHECIIDVRSFKDSAGITVDDIAKRLMDFGFHAPTMSWPVAGTLMIEPTESESKEELDRFCEAMITIREEIAEIEKGQASAEDNVLKNAPHTASVLMTDDWKHSYSREKAAFPLKWVKNNKFWPSVGRVDNAYGDKNLVCACLPVDAYNS